MKCIIQKNQYHIIKFFSQFFLILWVLHCASSFHLSPCPLVPISAHEIPPKSSKKTSAPHKRKNLVMESVLWLFELRIVPFYHSFLLISVHCYDTWSGLRPQASDNLPIMDSLWGFSCLYFCLMSWISCSFGSVGLTSSHAPAVNRYSDCWGGLSLSLGLGLSRSWVPHPFHTGNFSSTLSSGSMQLAARGWASSVLSSPDARH